MTERNEIVHKFERAGLGKAPFRFVGAEMKWFIVPGCKPRAGSSCDYCATSIAECCWIEDAEGKRFKVGNVCVNKTGDAGLIDYTKRALNKLRNEAKAVKDEARIKEAKALYASSLDFDFVDERLQVGFAERRCRTA